MVKKLTSVKTFVSIYESIMQHIAIFLKWEHIFDGSSFCVFVSVPVFLLDVRSGEFAPPFSC